MIQSSWGVPRDGFHWVEAQLASDPPTGTTVDRFLTPGFTLHWQHYDPFQATPALFWTFASVDPTEVGVQAFANLYGALGADVSILLPDGQYSRGERLEVWITEMVSMRHALSVWEALNTRAVETLARWFHLEDRGTFADVLFTPDEPWPPEVPMTIVQFLKRGRMHDGVWFLPFGPVEYRGDPTNIEMPMDVAGCALAFLRMQVNIRLQQHTSASLQYALDGSRSVPLGLHIVPKNLLGALWLQFAMAIEGQVPYKHCPQCESWFPVPAKARRASTTYCSPRCRVRAHRQRHAAGEHGPAQP